MMVPFPLGDVCVKTGNALCRFFQKDRLSCEEIIQAGWAEIFAIKNIGPKALNEINERLVELGFDEFFEWNTECTQ